MWCRAKTSYYGNPWEKAGELAMGLSQERVKADMIRDNIQDCHCLWHHPAWPCRTWGDLQALGHVEHCTSPCLWFTTFHAKIPPLPCRILLPLLILILFLLLLFLLHLVLPTSQPCRWEHWAQHKVGVRFDSGGRISHPVLESARKSTATAPLCRSGESMGTHSSLSRLHFTAVYIWRQLIWC